MAMLYCAWESEPMTVRDFLQLLDGLDLDARISFDVAGGDEPQHFKVIDVVSMSHPSGRKRAVVSLTPVPLGPA